MTGTPAHAHINIRRLNDAGAAGEDATALTVGEPERRPGAVLYGTSPEPAAARAA